ncbi:MAG: hypothetical protein HRT88_04130, partial [Lentisphaeraceae bacterium]|nr:hypothetical protein [Lentisphaeraceae bacterium]
MKKLISLMTLLATTIGLQGQTTNDRIQLTKAQSHLAKTVPMEIILEKSAIVFRLIPAGKFVMGSPKSEKGRSGSEGQRRMQIK